MIKISVITVAFNSCGTIRDTIGSVLAQTHPAVEYIIIDGRSTDGTVDIIRSYGGKISKFVSEPDKGIYDAMNKGLMLATGDVVCFLNSDDLYADPGVLSRVAKAFGDHAVDCVYGDLQYVDKNNVEKVVRLWRSRSYQPGLFKMGWYPPHPAFFVKKGIFEKYGNFDLKFRISADYELTLRFLEKHRISSFYLPGVLAKMRVGGESNRSLINILKANIECYMAWKENGLSYNVMNAFLKPLHKAGQYISRE